MIIQIYEIIKTRVTAYINVLLAPDKGLSKYKFSYGDKGEFKETSLSVLSRNFTGIKPLSCKGVRPSPSSRTMSRSPLYAQIVCVCTYVCGKFLWRCTRDLRDEGLDLARFVVGAIDQHCGRLRITYSLTHEEP